MGLELYAAQCKVLANELLEALDNSEIQALRDDLKGMDRFQWYRWREENAPVVLSYVAATPSLRDRKKAWRDNRLRRRLTLAAYQHCLEAHAVLDTIVSGDFSTGSSYRNMAAYAGPFFWRIVYSDISIWPFGDPSPFLD